MNHARRRLKATGQHHSGDQQSQCHSGCLLWAVWLGRGSAWSLIQTPRRNLMIAGLDDSHRRLQMPWCLLKQKQTWRERAIQSKCSRDIFLPEVPNSPTRAGLLLDTLLMDRKELFGNVVPDGSLGFSDHQWLSLNAEEKQEGQYTLVYSG